MGERTSYAPGTFSWVDLATSDPDGAKAFYGALFGWEAEDTDAGGGMTYTMLRLGGHDVAGLSAAGPDRPTAWSSYVTVDDADAVARRVADAGGQVVAPPFDVVDVGRMAVVADPVGAVLSLWEARGHAGAGLVNAPGALSWNDLVAPDPAPAQPFYGDLFGWEFEDVGGGAYWIVRNRGATNGGMMPLEGAHPAWLPYFAVEDLDATVARVGELGGTTLARSAVPAGRIATVRDPAGAVFAMFEGPLDP